MPNRKAPLHCEHGSQRCPRCKWASVGKRWQAEFPWLTERVEPWGIGCAVCASCPQATSASDTAFKLLQVTTVQGLQKCNIAKHGQSKCHRAAVSGEGDCGAPSIAEFKQTWADVRNAELEDEAGLTYIGESKKAKQIFCLAEAIRGLDRKFLARATCITLTQDGRKQRLLTQFCVTDTHLKTRSGIVGLQRDYGSGHTSLVTATEMSVDRLCTPWHNAPERGDERAPRTHLRCPVPKLVEELKRHFCMSVKVWNTDAAADELLAGATISTVGADGAMAIMPSIDTINRDKAHASRRTVMHRCASVLYVVCGRSLVCIRTARRARGFCSAHGTRTT